MTDIYNWSTTAADNDDADATINWTEGQAPGTVNNSARAMMTRVAQLLDDLGGVGTVGGTADAITVTSAMDSLAAGKLVAFKAGSANTGAATLNVNSLGVKAIRKKGDTALAAGEIAANGIYICRYDTAYNSAAGAWVLLNHEFILPSNAATLDTADQVVTGGARVTPLEIGGGTVTTGTVTPDPGDRPMQYYTNGGAHTLAPGSNKGYYVLEITNNASAGAVTTSGFTKVVGSFTTTDAEKFLCSVIVSETYSLLSIQALQ